MPDFIERPVEPGPGPVQAKKTPKANKANQIITWRNSIFSLLFIVCLMIGGTMLAANRLLGAGPLPAPKIVWIKPGTIGWTLARQLRDEGVVSDPYSFFLALRVQTSGRDIGSGEYRFNAYQPLQSVIAQLRRGDSIARQLTIPEGLTSAEIASLINNNPWLGGEAILPPPEGSLLPETYNFQRGDERAKLAERMRLAQQKLLDELWPRRAQGLLLETPQQAVTMASIVEKETALPGERGQVSGVYHNRLRRLMPLQADPTVIYAITKGAAPLGRQLTYNDLALVSPYNTYVVPGLPPAPIGNPGGAAIAAALHPEATENLFFVANGAGGHVFAATMAEHERNVAKWRQFEQDQKNKAK